MYANASQWQHLQHMPAHIYLRTGRYGDAVDANVRAHASDMQWLAHGTLPYGPGHNAAFLVYAACMDGQQRVAFNYSMELQSIYAAAPGNCAMRLLHVDVSQCVQTGLMVLLVTWHGTPLS